MNGWLDPAAAGPVLTPLVIFVAEMCVVTIGTTRTIFVSRGMKAPAALLGVFECSIWLFAVGQVFQNLGNLGCSAAYAGGFSLGNYLGVLLEEKLAVGSVLLRVITRRDAAPLVRDLAAADYGVTRLDGLGAVGPVQVVLTVVRRRRLGHVVGFVKRFDPGTFYSVDALQSAAAGVFPLRRRRPDAACYPGRSRSDASPAPKDRSTSADSTGSCTARLIQRPWRRSRPYRRNNP